MGGTEALAAPSSGRGLRRREYPTRPSACQRVVRPTVTIWKGRRTATTPYPVHTALRNLDASSTRQSLDLLFRNPLCIKMSVSRAPSPGAPDAEDYEAPQADDASDASADNTNELPLIVHYCKKYYTVPSNVVVVNQNKPIRVPNGLEAYEIHECKSFKKWVDLYDVHTRNIVKVKVVDNGATKIGWYVMFKIGDGETPDSRILRPLHKNIARQFYDLWVETWSKQKKEKHAELLADKPSDESQLNPEVLRWKLIKSPNGVLYERPKKKSADSSKKRKLDTKKASDPEGEDEDDAQSSAAQSTALIGVPQMNMSPMSPHAAAGTTNFYMQTPGAQGNHFSQAGRCAACFCVVHTSRPPTPRRYGQHLGSLLTDADRQPARVAQWLQRAPARLRANANEKG